MSTAPVSEREAASPAEAIEAGWETGVDLEAELEGLRDLVRRGGVVWLRHRLLIDLEEFEDNLDQIIDLLPPELRRSRRIAREEYRIIEDAKDEARRLLEEARAEADHMLCTAREESERLVDASAIRQRALEQSQAIICRAEETAEEIRGKSYLYAEQVMSSVEASLKRLAQTVAQDRSQLEQMRPAGQ